MLLPLFMFRQSFLVRSISNTVRMKAVCGRCSTWNIRNSVSSSEVYSDRFCCGEYGHTATLFRLVYLPKALLVWSEGKVRALPFARSHFPKAVYMVRRKSSALWHES